MQQGEMEPLPPQQDQHEARLFRVSPVPVKQELSVLSPVETKLRKLPLKRPTSAVSEDMRFPACAIACRPDKQLIAGAQGVDKRHDKGKDKVMSNAEDDLGSTEAQNSGWNRNAPALVNDFTEAQNSGRNRNAPALVKEDKIMFYLNMLLNEWKHELEDCSDIEKRNTKRKTSIQNLMRWRQFLEPLFVMCRNRVLPDVIRDALMYVVEKCRQTDYLSAMDQFTKLAMANIAPWHIGAALLGMNGQDKIHFNNVAAHIMNDETRNYLQAVKHLIVFCQKRHPPVPLSDNVVSSHDLQSSLSEVKLKKVRFTAEHRLQFMAS